MKEIYFFRNIQFLRSFAAVALLFSVSYIATAQYLINGLIRDTEAEPLAFVIVQWNDDVSKHVLSDLDGFFKISSDIPIKKISFKYTGKKTMVLEASEFFGRNSPLQITMTDDEFVMEEITVLPGQNPADVLMEKVILHAKTHDPMQMQGFSCRQYSKVHGQMKYLNDSSHESKLKLVNPLVMDSTIHDSTRGIFYMETYSNKYYKNPGLIHDEIIMNRVAGFRNTGMVALANTIQPFGFYRPIITLLDKEYLNPISVNSTEVYFFYLHDTLYDGIDTIWVVDFVPHKNAVANSLSGQLFIDGKSFAIRRVVAQVYKNNLAPIKIEQQYQYYEKESKWFPSALHFSWHWKDYPRPGISALIQGTSHMESVAFYDSLNWQAYHNQMPLRFLPDANHKNKEDDWRFLHDNYPMTLKEKQAFAFADSTFNTSRLRAIRIAVQGFSISKLLMYKNHGLDFSEFMNISEYEKVRLTLGFTNNTDKQLMLPPRWEYNARAGYGFGDKNWKYLLSLRHYISYKHGLSTGFVWQKDLYEPGAGNEFDKLLIKSRRSPARILDDRQMYKWENQIQVGRFFQFQSDFQFERSLPLYDYKYKELASEFQFFDASVQLRFLGLNISGMMQSRNNDYTAWPAVELQWQGNILNNNIFPFTYQNIQLRIFQKLPVKKMGPFEYQCIFGISQGNAPVQRLFSLNQASGTWFSFVAQQKLFQTIQANQFWFGDRIFKLYVAQDFGPIFYRKSWSMPRFGISHNMAYVSLHDRESHHSEMITLRQGGIHESGCFINQLVALSVRKIFRVGFGVAGFARWAEKPRFEAPFNSTSLRLTMQFVL